MRIREKVELFNQAFALAWCQIPAPANVTQGLELSEQLAGIVRTSINAGLDDAQAIADAAIASLKNS
jgi:hypothetical protein